MICRTIWDIKIKDQKEDISAGRWCIHGVVAQIPLEDLVSVYSIYQLGKYQELQLLRERVR